jgi:hypothetical protein
MEIGLVHICQLGNVTLVSGFKAFLIQSMLQGRDAAVEDGVGY